MDNTLFRCILIFHTLSDLIPHSIEQLSESLEVSMRTINNDFEDIKAMVSYFGCELRKNKLGYYIHVNDENQFNKCRILITTIIMQNPIVNGKPETFGRDRDILRTLFISEKKITFDEVCDTLFISKETLKADYRLARVQLHSYNLAIGKGENHPNVIGSEFHLRMCMVNLYAPVNEIYQIIHAKEPEQEQKFQSLFAVDTRDDLLHHMIIEEVFSQNYFLLRENAVKLYEYMNLSENRTKSGHFLAFNEDEEKFLRQFPEYGIAKNVMDIVIPQESQHIREAEILGMTLFLLMYEDIDYRSDLKTHFGALYEKASRMADDAAVQIKKSWNYPIYAIPEYKELLIASLIPLLVQLQFKAAGYFRNYLKINQKELYADCFSSQMMLSAIESWKIMDESTLSRYNLSLLSHTFNEIVMRGEGENYRKKIAVYSEYGIDGAYDLIDRIKGFIPGKYIAEIDPVIPRKLESIDYDMIVIQSNYWIGEKKSHYLVDTIPTIEQMTDIYKAVISPKDNYKAIIQTFRCEPEFKTSTISEKHKFIDALSKEIGKDKASAKRIQDNLCIYGRLFIHDKILTLFVEKECIGKDLFQIYTMKAGMQWRKKKVNTVIVTTADCNNSTAKGKVISEYTYQLSTNPKAMDQFIETHDYSILADALYKTN